MEESNEKEHKVEELENFPFETFEEYRKAVFEEVAQPGVDRSIALQWAQSGKYAPKFLNISVTFLGFLPFITAIGFITYATIAKSWLLLIALPVLIIAYFVFHPSFARLLGPIHGLLVIAMFGGLGWGLYKQLPWLIALSIALVVIWYANNQVYKKAVNSLVEKVCEHEDLLCILWCGKALNIAFFNGNRYWIDWKVEDGEHVNY